MDAANRIVCFMKSREGVLSENSLFEQETQRHCYKEATEPQLASFIVEQNLPFTLVKPVFLNLWAIKQSSSRPRSYDKNLVGCNYLDI